MNKFSKQYKDSQNKSKWISNKIDKLVSEGKPKKQAIAISNAMWNSRKADGGSFYGDKPLKKMQDGPYPTRSMEGVVIPFMPGQEDDDYYTQYFEQQKLKMPNQSGIQAATQKENVVNTPEFQKWAAENLDVKNQYTNPYNFDGTKGEDLEAKTKPFDMDEFNETMRVSKEGVNTYKNTNKEVTTEDEIQEDPYNNPYMLGSTESNFYNLGSAIESGNKGLAAISGIGAGASVLDTALGSARSFMSGRGQARRRQDIINQRREESRDTASGVNRVESKKDGGEYYADGGGYESYGYGGKKKMYKQDGGEVDQDRILTGEVLTGVSGNNQSVEPNTEIEDGEYVLSRDGQSIKVEGKKHSQGGEDVELQDGDKVISDNLKLKGANAKAVRDKFDVKAKAKDTYATVVDKVYKKIGLDKLIKEEEEVISRIRKQEEKLGEGATKDLNLQLLYKKKDKIGEEKQKLEEQRQNVLNEVYNMQEASKPKEETSQQEMKKGGEYEKMQGGGEKERFQSYVQQLIGLGYKPDSNKTYEEQIKDVQNWVAENNPEAVQQYFQENPVTNKGLQQIKERNPEVFKEAGVKPIKNLAELSPKDRKKIQDTYKSKLDKEEYNNFIIDQFKDGLFDYRTPIFAPPTLESIGVVTGTGELSAPNVPDSAVNQVTKNTPEQVNGEVNTKNNQDSKSSAINFQGFQGRPDQSVLPPSGVDSQLKANRRYDRIDPNLMSPDQIIQENERRAQAAIKSAQQLPDSQRAAVIAQITAQTQAANQQAISQVDASNTQILNTTEAQNAQIQAREQDAAVQDALSFEKRQQTAESITDENVRGFLDYNRKVNLQNFNDARRQNTINRAFENFNLDAQGNIINEGGYDIDYRNYLMGLRRQGGLANAPQKTTKKKS